MAILRKKQAVGSWDDGGISDTKACATKVIVFQQYFHFHLQFFYFWFSFLLDDARTKTLKMLTFCAFCVWVSYRGHCSLLSVVIVHYCTITKCKSSGAPRPYRSLHAWTQVDWTVAVRFGSADVASLLPAEVIIGMLFLSPSFPLLFTPNLVSFSDVTAEGNWKARSVLSLCCVLDCYCSNAMTCMTYSGCSFAIFSGGRVTTWIVCVLSAATPATILISMDRW